MAEGNGYKHFSPDEVEEQHNDLHASNKTKGGRSQKMEQLTQETPQQELLVEADATGNGSPEENDAQSQNEDNEEPSGPAVSMTSKKNKKRRNKKKAATAAAKGLGEATGGSKVPPSRGVNGFTDSYVKYGQTDPPSIPVAKLFQSGHFPEGEIMEHPGDFNTFRMTDAEKKAGERLDAELYDKMRLASEVHRQVRKYAQGIIEPGIKLTDMCERLEDKNRQLIEEKGLQRGIGFPTGCSLNHVAAHYTPNGGDDTVLQYGDVMKVDFGTQIEGRIIDCAWTVCFDPTFDNLLEAVREATNSGIKAAGIDVRLGDVGEVIQVGTL